MQIIPIAAIPNQTLTINVNNQPTRLNIYQKGVSQSDEYLTLEDGFNVLQTEDQFPLEVPPNLDWLPTPIYVDIYLSNTLLLAGVIAKNANVLLRNSYFGYKGDFAFYDTQGSEDPSYEGLGTRFILVYLAPGDIIPSSIETLEVSST